MIIVVVMIVIAVAQNIELIVNFIYRVSQSFFLISLFQFN